MTWLVSSALFSWYVANFGSFNKTYGSLGAIIGFMMWMWLSIIVILVGAKLNAEIEHQTARETTAGQPKPLGWRGAKMADTIGPARTLSTIFAHRQPCIGSGNLIWPAPTLCAGCRSSR